MAVMKVIEILSSSKKGWEDAAHKAVKEASKSVKNIQSIYIKEQTAVVTDNEITEYRINAKITFKVN